MRPHRSDIRFLAQLGGVLWALILVSSAWSADGPAMTGAPVVFEAYDYGFRGPDRIPAGMATMEVVNRGRDLHHLQLVELVEGKTAEDFLVALRNASPGFPAWVKFVGGPNAVAPGGQATATMRLSAGNYVLLCLIPDQKGAPHVALGMVKPLTVTPMSGTVASEPASDVTITQRDFDFVFSTPIKAGRRTIQVINEGAQPHEVVVVKLASGATVKDFGAAFEPGGSGLPPGQPLGGLVGLEHGGRGFFTVQFEPGRYGLICFFPDPATGAPHFVKGMMLDFSVE